MVARNQRSGNGGPSLQNLWRTGWRGGGDFPISDKGVGHCVSRWCRRVGCRCPESKHGRWFDGSEFLNFSVVLGVIIHLSFGASDDREQTNARLLSSLFEKGFLLSTRPVSPRIIHSSLAHSNAFCQFSSNSLGGECNCPYHQQKEKEIKISETHTTQQQPESLSTPSKIAQEHRTPYPVSRS